MELFIIQIASRIRTAPEPGLVPTSPRTRQIALSFLALSFSSGQGTEASFPLNGRSD